MALSKDEATALIDGAIDEAAAQENADDKSCARWYALGMIEFAHEDGTLTDDEYNECIATAMDKVPLTPTDPQE